MFSVDLTRLDLILYTESYAMSMIFKSITLQKFTEDMFANLSTKDSVYWIMCKSVF